MGVPSYLLLTRLVALTIVLCLLKSARADLTALAEFVEHSRHQGRTTVPVLRVGLSFPKAAARLDDAGLCFQYGRLIPIRVAAAIGRA